MILHSNEDFRPLVERAAAGDGDAWKTIVSHCNSRLRRMVALRLDRSLQGRVDPSDVLQEAYLEASQQLEQYLANSKIPFFIWLRLIAGAKLIRAHRHHLGTQMRDASRDVSLFDIEFPEASSVALAEELVASGVHPPEAAAQAEEEHRVHEALAQLDSEEREVLALRHFEQMTFAECGAVLSLSEAGAGKRYLKALERMKLLLARSQP